MISLASFPQTLLGFLLLICLTTLFFSFYWFGYNRHLFGNCLFTANKLAYLDVYMCWPPLIHSPAFLNRSYAAVLCFQSGVLQKFPCCLLGFLFADLSRFFLTSSVIPAWLFLKWRTMAVACLACSAPLELVQLSSLWSLSQSGASIGRARATNLRTAFAPVGSDHMLHGIIADRTQKCHLCFICWYDICQSTGGRLMSPIATVFPASLISSSVLNSRHFAILGQHHYLS